MRNKLVLDAYDAVIAKCRKHIASAKKAKLEKNHTRLDAALGGKISAYSMILNFCQMKKTKP